MNTWNTLPESYQRRVYKHTLATVKSRMEQVENPTPAVVISMEVVHVDNAVLPDYLTLEVALEEPQIGSPDTNILIENNCKDDKLHSGKAGGSGDYQDEGDESDEHNPIPTASQRRWATIEPDRGDVATIDVDWYEGEDGNDADADQTEEASPANHGSTQNMEGGGHCRFDPETSDVDGYEGEDGDDEDADEVEEASQADDG